MATHANAKEYAWLYANVTDLAGVAGQGNKNPASLFENHALALVNGRYYDPSYGKDYSSPQNLESAMAGYFHYLDYGVSSNGEWFPGMEIRKDFLPGQTVNIYDENPANY